MGNLKSLGPSRPWTVCFWPHHKNGIGAQLKASVPAVLGPVQPAEGSFSRMLRSLSVLSHIRFS